MNAAAGLAVCMYGQTYLPMLIAFLESWGETFPKIYLALADVEPGVSSDIARAYPEVEILSFETKLSNEMHVRISQKMIFWEHLANHLAAGPHDFVVFADADTICVGDIAPFCEGDIVITEREPASHFLVNTGVVGFSRKALASGFVSEWRNATEEIINDPKRLSEAVNPANCYGGGDQMAIIQLLRLNDRDEYRRFRDMIVRLVPCSEYNACGNVVDPITARVFHLKASLNNFLLHRRPLTGTRKMQDSMFQLQLAAALNRRGAARLGEAGVSPERIAGLYGIRVPYGVRDDLTMPIYLDGLYRARAAARTAVGRILKGVRTGHRNQSRADRNQRSGAGRTKAK